MSQYQSKKRKKNTDDDGSRDVSNGPEWDPRGLCAVIADVIKSNKHEGVTKFTVGYKDRPDDKQWINGECHILDNVGGEGSIVVNLKPTKDPGKVHFINPQHDIIIDDVDWPFMCPEYLNREVGYGKCILYGTVWKIREGVCVHVIFGW